MYKHLRRAADKAWGLSAFIALISLLAGFNSTNDGGLALIVVGLVFASISGVIFSLSRAVGAAEKESSERASREARAASESGDRDARLAKLIAVEIVDALRRAKSPTK